MVRTPRALTGLLAVVALAACRSGGGAAPAAGAASAPAPARPVSAARVEPTTADGIFTQVQAERGLALFESVCSECHDTDDWTEAGFRGRWESQSVFQLWYFINDRMPYDDPWSLSRQQVTDVLTYILQLNGLPAGDRELATDDDTIDDFWIAWAPSR